ncbi:MAG TPA: hypothetical protein VF228_01135 [Iamia sp.]
MRRPLMTKVLAAVVAGGLVVALAPAPAGAGAVAAGTVHIGTGISAPLGSSSVGPCAVPASAFDASFSLGVDGATTNAGTSLRSAFEMTAGDWWTLELTPLSDTDPGDVTQNWPWGFYEIVDWDVLFLLTVRDVNNGSCAPIGQPCQGFAPMLISAFLFGPLSGPSLLILDGFSIDSPTGTTIVMGNCTGLPINGQTIDILGLEADHP